MFEKLGEVLRKVTDRIANAIFLDKNLMDSVIKDLQRALIEADVNILLVKQLSDKIRKSALDERIKEIEKKEHIIKLLHDELAAILGEYKQLKLRKEENRIMFLGLYGAGKCVHADSNIQLSDGNIVRIEDLYKGYEKKGVVGILEGGEIIDIRNENLLVPSFNPKTAKIENKKATHLWKLNKKNLIEVKVNNGNDYSIKVTPEHPFFALRGGTINKIRADEIDYDDFIAIPRGIEVKGNLMDLSEKIKNFNLANIKDKRIKPINFPSFLNPELAEFIGYVMGDGHIGKRYIEIVTEDREIMDRIIYLSKNLFNLNLSSKRDLRTKKMVKLTLMSSTLVKIFSIFNLKPGKKGKQLKIPDEILKSDKEVIRSFIRAYFDCDSCAAKNRRSIELTSESNILIKQMNLLLNRFNIASTISKKLINDIPYWRLIIKSKSAELYANKIGYLIERKQKIADSYKIIGTNQGCGDQEMLPLGKILKEIREKLGSSIGEVQTNAVFSYGRYEESGFISRGHLKKLINYYRSMKGRFFQIFDSISKKEDIYKKYSKEIINGLIHFLENQGLTSKKGKNIILTENGEKSLQLIKSSDLAEILDNLELLSESNVFWAPVKETNRIINEREIVYDLTVEDNHSFIAEGFIVHNTTTIAKLGNYFSKRGNKVALVGLDVHRPAAKEQLKQLAEKNKIPYFVDFEEKNALKTWKKFQLELKEYQVVLIDTAGRHTLDKELIEEISSLSKEIKPTETILVMPADIGQAAKKQSQEFLQAVNISGVIITRMDSTARGGGTITACAETKAPVYFIGTGEKINDIEEFNPKTFLSRLLGMGDLQTLIEKIRSITDEKDKEKIQKKIGEGKISLEDVIEQVKSMNSLGGFEKIKGMIPGLSGLKGKIPENMFENQEAKFSKWEHILKSMTPEERENPEFLEKQTSRIARIAKGAGVHTSDIRSLLKQYKLLNDMLKSGAGDIEDMSRGLNQKQLQKLAKKFGKKMRF